MPSFTDALNQGAAHAWLFIPTAILLGALHGLEPGHSKTMMAAFIIAIRGTVWQAILLGLCAAISHSLIIWALAAAALHYGSQWNAETSEPYFQIVSAVLILGLAVWMFWRTWRDQRRANHRHENEGPHGGKAVAMHDETWELEVFETGVPPRFRLHRYGKSFQALPPPDLAVVGLETVRPDGSRHRFKMVKREKFLESLDEIPEPHDFVATLRVSHGHHAHTYEVAFSDHDHSHAHANPDMHDLEEGDDAHAREHANDLRRRFANRQVTTGQIAMFGITGGLLPCPAALTVLLVCMQLKRFALGATLVLSFSFGLALTMVTVGVAAALSMRHASKRFKGFERFASRAPYFSSALLVVLAVFVGYQGWAHLP